MIQFDYGEGRVYGAKYYTLAPVRPELYSVPSSIEWNEMVEWCSQIFGPTTEEGVWVPDQRWYINDSKFWFRNEKDRNWFILKWE